MHLDASKRNEGAKVGEGILVYEEVVPLICSQRAIESNSQSKPSFRPLHTLKSTMAPVPLTVIKGAGHEHIQLPPNDHATVADFHSIRTQSSPTPAYLTSGFYRITPGPPKPASYDFEETKYVLSGQIDVLDEATGITHHLTAGDFAFFYVGSKVQFSTRSEGMAFYAVTRPVRAEHGNLVSRVVGERGVPGSSSKL